MEDIRKEIATFANCAGGKLYIDVKDDDSGIGVYVRQRYSSVPATNSAIQRMIKETDGDRYCKRFV